MMKTTVAALLLLACASCASTPRQEAPVPPQDVEISSNAVSRIYVLRVPEARGYYETARVEDGGRDIGTMGDGQFLCWERASEPTLVTVTVEPVDGDTTGLFVEVPCEAGQAYYYAISVDEAWGRARLRRLESGPARKLLAELSLPPH